MHVSRFRAVYYASTIALSSGLSDREWLPQYESDADSRYWSSQLPDRRDQNQDPIRPSRRTRLLDLFQLTTNDTLYLYTSDGRGDVARVGMAGVRRWLGTDAGTQRAGEHGASPKPRVGSASPFLHGS